MLKPVQASSYTFRTIIEGGYLYIDKTRFLYELVHRPVGLYFLARPRRFGKSLMISTLEAIFQGNRQLFQNMWIAESDYEWLPHPVIRIDFSRSPVSSAAQLRQVLDFFIEDIAQKNSLVLRGFDYQSRFDNLIQQLGTQRKVVILVDEYDKPILDNLEDVAEVNEIRDILRGFYTIIKANDQYLRFVMITGISKFGRVGIFSGLNNLDDLTMDPRFASALGITETELRSNFSEHITDFAQHEASTEAALLQKIRDWYNGFCFVANCERVYNPFSTLQLFNKRRFVNYWFETGTPSFLVRLLRDREYDIEELDNLRLREVAFSTYEIENLSIVPLLFQTGYLTIKAYESATQRYTLSYPNYEVEDAFLAWLLSGFNEREKAINENTLWQLVDALEANKLDEFFTTLETFFAAIPYGLQLKQEKYYQTIFYLIFKLIGLRIDAEVQTNRGRIDAVVEVAKQIFLFEFKLDGEAESALRQIQEHDYARRYQQKGKAVTLVGVNFDSAKRMISDWKTSAGTIEP